METTQWMKNEELAAEETITAQKKKQHRSLVAQILLVPGDHGSNPCEGEKIFFFRFVVMLS